MVFRDTYDATCGDNRFPPSKVIGCAGLIGPGIFITGIRMRQPKCRNGDHRVPEVVGATLNKQNRQTLVSLRKSACDNAASGAAYDQESMMVEIY